MRRILLILSIALALVVSQTKREREHASAVKAYNRSLASQTDNCTDKKFCAVVYLAPWCPSCNQMAPQLRTAVQRAKSKTEFGMKVVVGKGTFAQNAEEAASFGEAGSADQDDTVHKALGVKQYPSFFVMDKDKTIILSDREAFDWLNEKLR